MKLVVTLILLFGFINCNKNDVSCETWVVQDMCYAKNPSVTCETFSPRKLQICGDRLDDAKHNRETITHETDDVKQTIRYIRKVNQ